MIYFLKIKTTITACVLAIIAATFFPMWSIWLYAPQYPEGLGMQIWFDDIKGLKEFDLENINLLNHYIGMASISNEMAEFLYIPLVFLYLTILSFLCLLFSKRFLLRFTFVNFIVFSIVGLFDFLYWEYKYGHNLKPNAPIQMPGMTYQPPFIGCDNLLNITACSYPDFGGFLMAIAVVFLGLAILIEKRRPIQKIDLFKKK